MPNDLVPSLPLNPPDPGPPARLAYAADLVADFLAGRAATTRLAYAADLERFARWSHADPVAPIGAILDYFLARDAGDANGLVLRYRNELVERGLASATIARRLAALKSFVKLARTLGRVAWSIEIAAPKPEPRRDVRGPDREARKKLWKAVGAAGNSARDRRDRAILGLLFDLGLRRGEVVALDLADLDFAAGSIQIVGKGKREKARLELPPSTSRDLGAWVVVRGSEPGPLFYRTDRPGSKERLTGDGLARAVARLGALARLPKRLRPHGLRHAAITAALSGRNNIREVMGFSRHAKLETVMRYDDELKNKAAEVAREVARERK